MHHVNFILINRPYECSLCDKSYYRKYQLFKHLAKRHPGHPIDFESKSAAPMTVHIETLTPSQPLSISSHSSSGSID